MPNTFELRVTMDKLPDVIQRWSKSAGETLARLALLTEGYAKANIQSNGTIQTGAMLNGVYTVTGSGVNEYASAAGAVASRRGEQYVLGGGDELAGTTDPTASAAVACAASYAVYIEYNGWPFMTPAVDSAEGELERLAKELFLSEF